MNSRLLLIITCVIALSACGGAEERKSVYMEKALNSIEKGDLDKARIELKNVLQIDPKDSEAYYQLGKLFEKKKEYRKAYVNYLKAEELNPGHLNNQARLGRFYLLLTNDTDKAKEKIAIVLTKEPLHADGLLLKSALLLKENNIKEAIGVVENSIKTHPGHIESIQFLTSLYVKEGRSTDAEKLLRDSLVIEKQNTSLSSMLASILVANKKYEEAEIIYKDILNKNPDNKLSYENLASFYIQMNDTELAEKTLRESVAYDENDVGRKLVLVRYIKEIKGPEKAIEELNYYINKDNNSGELRTALASLYIVTGDKDAAVDAYKSAITDFSEESTGIVSRVALAHLYMISTTSSTRKRLSGRQ